MGTSQIGCCNFVPQTEQLQEQTFPNKKDQKLSSEEQNDSSNQTTTYEQVLEDLPLSIKTVLLQKCYNLHKIEPFKDKITSKQLTRLPTSNNHNHKIYQGQLHDGVPTGWGRLYNENEKSLYVGHFRNNRFHGEGIYIFEDGSFMEGNFEAGSAQGVGKFESEELEYEGQFKNNLFHGKGKQKNRNYQFEGNYQEGRRIEGRFLWRDEGKGQFQYIGKIDKNQQFTGKGVLIQPFGRYQGDFENGLKHGEGKYLFSSGLKYVGSYYLGKKSGNGTVYNSDGSISYQGSWSGNLPNGKGKMYNKHKDIIESQFIDGVDIKFIPKKQQSRLRAKRRDSFNSDGYKVENFIQDEE